MMILIAVLALMLVGVAVPSSAGGRAASTGGDGIVSTVLKAPITPDGDVAGRPTDVVITLDTSLDPEVEGRTLLAGETIKVTLPDIS
jgi:hypothetical protein